MKPHHQLNPHQTLGSIIDEVVVDFPAKPYGQILAQPQLHQYLCHKVILRLTQTYPWRDEVKLSPSSLSPEFREQLFRIHLESAIYWGLEEIVQQNLDIPHTT